MHDRAEERKRKRKRKRKGERDTFVETEFLENTAKDVSDGARHVHKGSLLAQAEPGSHRKDLTAKERGRVNGSQPGATEKEKGRPGPGF